MLTLFLFSVLEVDVKVADNNAKHHTDLMSTTQLIMRRGQSFSIHLKFKEPFNPGVHNLVFTATLGNIPDKIRGTKCVFGIPDFVKRAPNAKAIWKAELSPDQKGRNVVVNITPPADAPVGKYSLFLNYLGEDKKLGHFPLIFNPWCTDDSVYMENEEKIQEYVLNERGVIFKGSGNYISPMFWDYGQDDMVEIALTLLYVSPEHLTNPMKDEAARYNPIYVSRIISRMINSDEDRGVLKGQWEGPYIGGMSPTHWSGSYPILKRWYNIGCHPVKFGQCWVFAGVMCSVMRALGIPCRVITNYESAHDCDKNLTIDVYHADWGVKEIPSPDSIWTFHVWCEGWMKRPDLSPEFDGWQVLDPTPQELSGGVHRCGPAPVKAILNGNTDLDYDVPFVFAEVNADCNDYLVFKNGSKKTISTDSRRVGQNISTKSVGSNKRWDITSHYKHTEGQAHRIKYRPQVKKNKLSLTRLSFACLCSANSFTIVTKSSFLAQLFSM
uniref:protein-glutamine gamma-glutamyltransferase n=1 Tax=Neogobius melanostomus TaxID=47308 RepID=A0A8C6WHX8_9GOBI